MEIRSTEVFDFNGPYGSDYGLLMSKVFKATLDGGKTHFDKHFSCVVNAQSKRQYDEFLHSVKVGDKVEVSTVSTGYSTPSLVKFRSS